jgi:hypothetical protein
MAAIKVAEQDERECGTPEEWKRFWASREEFEDKQDWLDSRPAPASDSYTRYMALWDDLLEDEDVVSHFRRYCIFMDQKEKQDRET